MLLTVRDALTEDGHDGLALDSIRCSTAFRTIAAMLCGSLAEPT